MSTLNDSHIQMPDTAQYNPHDEFIQIKVLSIVFQKQYVKSTYYEIILEVGGRFSPVYILDSWSKFVRRILVLRFDERSSVS